MSQPLANPLNAALEAEHAAIFGYGVVGSHLTKGERISARQAEAAHRKRRDFVMLRVAAANLTPAAGSPAYELPFEVNSRKSALQLAIALEEGTSRAWYRALAGTAGDERKLSLDALTDSALRAARWRKLAGVTPTTVAFPGSPA